MDRVGGEATTSATVFQYALYLLSKGTVAMEENYVTAQIPPASLFFLFAYPLDLIPLELD
jgi:hypothetical protein